MAKNSILPIRPAVADDAAGIQAIMAYYILETNCNWRYKVMDQNETRQWLAQHMVRDVHKVWVATDQEKIVAYGCLSDFRAPEAYQVCAEDSVYVLPDYKGLGIGNRLMEQLIKQAAEHGLKTLVAAINADNTSSVRFHERHGFVKSGLLRRVGFKYGQCLDLLLMTLDLQNSQPQAERDDA